MQNLGNTCFVNAVVQCLVALPEFRVRLDQEMQRVLYTEASKHTRVGRKRRADDSRREDQMHLAEALLGLLQEVAEEGPNTSSTRRLRRLLHAASECTELIVPFGECQQKQDAGELVIFLLDSLHEVLQHQEVHHRNSPSRLLVSQQQAELEAECLEQLKTCVVADPETYNQAVCVLGDVRWDRYLKREESIITDMFTGQIEFRILSISLDSSKSVQSLEECLENYRHMEELAHENRVFCDVQCKDKTNRRTQVLLQRTPPILIIQLQRFEPTNTSVEKIGTDVEFPVRRSLNITQNMFMRDESKPVKYRLMAVCAHLGSSLDNGHYIAYRRCARSQEWMRLDDDRKSTLSSAELLQQARDQSTYCFMSGTGHPSSKARRKKEKHCCVLHFPS